MAPLYVLINLGRNGTTKPSASQGEKKGHFPSTVGIAKEKGETIDLGKVRKSTKGTWEGKKGGLSSRRDEDQRRLRVDNPLRLKPEIKPDMQEKMGWKSKGNGDAYGTEGESKDGTDPTSGNRKGVSSEKEKRGPFLTRGAELRANDKTFDPSESSTGSS